MRAGRARWWPRRSVVAAGLLGALVLMGVIPGWQEAGAAAAAPRGLEGSARLEDCSAALVRWASSKPDDPALVMTNGHCLGFPLLGAREVRVDEATDTRITLLDRSGATAVSLRAERLVYATMFKTDAALYRLPLSYAEIAGEHGVRPYTVSAKPSTRRTPIRIVSGYWKRVYTCTLRGFAYRLHEGPWDWHSSLRYTASGGCDVVGGTSGSPIVDPDGRVVGLNNTGYVGGRACVKTVCEQSRSGRVSVHPDRNYGQQVWWFTTCLTPDRALDLERRGCRLPSPR